MHNSKSDYFYLASSLEPMPSSDKNILKRDLQTKGPKAAQATKSAAISPAGSIDLVSELA